MSPDTQPATDVLDPPTPPATPDRELTLEEWIAAGQACCGADADDKRD